MKKDNRQQREYMICNECNMFAVGCKETCPYRIPIAEGRPSRITTRKAMKKEKKYEVRNLRVKLAVASSKERNTKKRKENKKAAIKKNQAFKQLKKALNRQDRRMNKCKSKK